MAWINSPFSIDDAISRKFATWDLLVSQWGYQPNPVLPSPQYNMSFPSVGQRGLPSVFGVAIGDQSEVDRCFLSYSIEKMVPKDTMWDVAHRLSVVSPLMFPQAGQREVIQPGPGNTDPNPQTGNASLVVYPTGTTSIINNGGVSPTFFNTQYKNAAGSLVAFPSSAAPLLHLVFYLKPFAVGAPIRRAPYTKFGSHSFVGPTEVLVFAAPTFGRKTVIVNYSHTGGSTYSVRVAAITNANLMATIGEVDLFSAAGIAAGTSQRIVVTPANADYIMVYAASAAANSVQATVTATDD